MHTKISHVLATSMPDILAHSNATYTRAQQCHVVYSGTTKMSYVLLSTSKQQDYIASYPDVNLRPGVVLAFEHFRCRVRRTSAPRGQMTGSGEEVAEAEIGDLDVHVAIEQ